MQSGLEKIQANKKCHYIGWQYMLPECNDFHVQTKFQKKQSGLQKKTGEQKMRLNCDLIYVARI